MRDAVPPRLVSRLSHAKGMSWSGRPVGGRMVTREARKCTAIGTCPHSIVPRACVRTLQNGRVEIRENQFIQENPCLVGEGQGGGSGGSGRLRNKTGGTSLTVDRLIFITPVRSSRRAGPALASQFGCHSVRHCGAQLRSQCPPFAPLSLAAISRKSLQQTGLINAPREKSTPRRARALSGPPPPAY